MYGDWVLGFTCITQMPFWLCHGYRTWGLYRFWRV